MSNKEIISRGLPLIKFQNEERIKSFQSGIVYMKSLEYYRKEEERSGDCTVGDLYEGMIHTNEATIIIPELGINETMYDALLNTSFSNSFVFCMLSPDLKTDKFEFTDEQKEKLLSFGDTALVITNREEFLKRVYFALEEHKIKGYFGKVTYYDETKDNFDVWQSLQTNGMSNIAFYKRMRYSYQQEFRLLIEPPETKDDYYKLNIGSIEDISVIIPSKDALKIIINPCKSQN